jgi:hypothetical protein
MGMLDYLIDKNQKEPKEGAEYLYLDDGAWKDGEFKTFAIPTGTIVRELKERGYDLRTLKFSIDRSKKSIRDYNRS